jgi:hypothetical protein
MSTVELLEQIRTRLLDEAESSLARADQYRVIDRSSRGPGSRQALQEQLPLGCGRWRPLSNHLAEDGEVVIAVHGEEFTVQQFREVVKTVRSL